MSRIVLESRNPSWSKADLRMCRIKNPDKTEVGLHFIHSCQLSIAKSNPNSLQVINFKELSWQTLRIEAKSTVNDDLTPLRLITNTARCRITIKKKVAGKRNI